MGAGEDCSLAGFQRCFWRAGKRVLLEAEVERAIGMLMAAIGSVLVLEAPMEVLMYPSVWDVWIAWN